MVGWRHWLLGKLNKYSCLGFRDKAEQASDLAFNLPGHCPDCEWLSVTACCDYKTKMGEKSWDCWGSWRGSGQPSPRLNYIPSFTQQNKQHQHETRAAIFEVSPTELTCCLGPFPSWDSRCAVTQDFPALINSGCWSKPNLVMHSLLFLVLFSFNVSMLKVS